MKKKDIIFLVMISSIIALICLFFTIHSEIKRGDVPEQKNVLRNIDEEELFPDYENTKKAAITFLVAARETDNEANKLRHDKYQSLRNVAFSLAIVFMVYTYIFLKLLRSTKISN